MMTLFSILLVSEKYLVLRLFRHRLSEPKAIQPSHFRACKLEFPCAFAVATGVSEEPFFNATCRYIPV